MILMKETSISTSDEHDLNEHQLVILHLMNAIH